MRQTAFEFFGKNVRKFGGELLVGKRKTVRPLSTKEPIELVLKSEGHNVFFPGDRRIESLFHKHAHKYGVKLYRVSLVWNHVHLLIKISDRDDYKAFIRTVTAALVSLISQIRKVDFRGLFTLRPFTRIVAWGRDFRNMHEYHDLNEMEAFGLGNGAKWPSWPSW